MKKMYFLFSLFFIASSCFSQLNHIPILIGKTVSEVTIYLDSLNKLRYNYNIRKVTTAKGDLVLETRFSYSDEKYYSCRGILTLFKEFKGAKICIYQSVYGDVEYAKYNLTFVKKYFKLISKDLWKTIYKSGKTYARFQEVNGNFFIDYSNFNGTLQGGVIVEDSVSDLHGSLLAQG